MSLVSRGYWREVRRKAWEESSRPFGGSGALAFALLLSLAAVPVVGVLSGWQEASVALVVAFVPIAVLATLLLVNFFRAPRLVHEESLGSIALIEKQRDELTLRFQKMQERQTVADMLSEKRADGVHRILVRRFMVAQDQTSFAQACAEADEWLEDVVDSMESAGCTNQEVQHVQILGTFPPLGLRPDREKIDKKASEFSARLDKVKDIAEKYARDAHNGG